MMTRSIKDAVFFFIVCINMSFMAKDALPIFSNAEVSALIDELGLIPSCLITPDIAKLIQHQLQMKRFTDAMSAEEERMAHQFLEYVMQRNRKQGKKQRDYFDCSEQLKFDFVNFD